MFRFVVAAQTDVKENLKISIMWSWLIECLMRLYQEFLFDLAQLSLDLIRTRFSFLHSEQMLQPLAPITTNYITIVNKYTNKFVIELGKLIIPNKMN